MPTEREMPRPAVRHREICPASNRPEISLTRSEVDDLVAPARKENPPTLRCAIDGPICRCTKTMTLFGTYSCNGGQVYGYACETCGHELRITAWD